MEKVRLNIKIFWILNFYLYLCGADQLQKARARKFKLKHIHEEKTRVSRLYMQTLSLRYKRLCGCKECGIKNPTVLQYDHRNPKDKICNVCQMINESFSLRRFKEEIRKCDVLCANCHLIKTARNNNYFSYYYKG